MKKIISLAAILCMVLMLAACGDDKVTPDSVNGEWVVDVQASQAAFGENNVAVHVKGIVFKFDVKAKTYTLIEGSISEPSPFEIESQKDNVFMMKIKGDTVKVTFNKKDGKETLTMVDQNNSENAVVLTRK